MHLCILYFDTKDRFETIFFCKCNELVTYSLKGRCFMLHCTSWYILGMTFVFTAFQTIKQRVQVKHCWKDTASFFMSTHHS